DGIRDFHVTGVQTCALPICNTGDKTAIQAWLDKQSDAAEASSEVADPLGLAQQGDSEKKKPETREAEPVSLANPQLLRNAGDERSEERRVGKGCRSRRPHAQ